MGFYLALLELVKEHRCEDSVFGFSTFSVDLKRCVYSAFTHWLVYILLVLFLVVFFFLQHYRTIFRKASMIRLTDHK